MTSYYSRNAGTYDTLLQMCRWFGYRPGYEDLCRVYLTQENIDRWLCTRHHQSDIGNGQYGRASRYNCTPDLRDPSLNYVNQVNDCPAKWTIAPESERLLGERGQKRAAESKKSAARNDERPRAIWISKREMRGNSWISAISSHFWAKSLGRLFYQNNLPNMAERVGFEPTCPWRPTVFESKFAI